MYPILNAYDRCDALGCNAAALVRFFQANRDLCMCGHHANRYESELRAQHFLLYEDRRADLQGENRLQGSDH